MCRSAAICCRNLTKSLAFCFRLKITTRSMWVVLDGLDSDNANGIKIVYLVALLLNKDHYAVFRIRRCPSSKYM